MLDFLELEETVGKAWHRLVGTTSSMQRHPQFGVSFDEVKPILGTCFRGFGGEGAVQLSPAHGRTSSHRLRLRQLVGLGEEKVAGAARDHGTVVMPPVIDLYPDRALNRDLYIWLSAFMAVMERKELAAFDPLCRDLEAIERARQTVAMTLALFPGLRAPYRRLSEATLSARRRGTLPPVERLIEARIASLLKFGAGLRDDTPPAIFPRLAPPGYKPMMAVPLWPVFECRDEIAAETRDDDITDQQPRPASTR